MRKLSFSELPLTIKIVTWLAVNNTWWSMEEFVIDRKGLWKYMPGYRVAEGCIWDLGVAIVVALVIWRASVHASSEAI